MAVLYPLHVPRKIHDQLSNCVRYFLRSRDFMPATVIKNTLPFTKVSELYTGRPLGVSRADNVDSREIDLEIAGHAGEVETKAIRRWW